MRWGPPCWESCRIGSACANLFIFIGSVVALFAWIPILFFPEFPVWLLVSLSVLVGFASGSVIIGFAFVKESVPPRFAGTVTGIYNMGSILGAMILQPAIGWMLDRNWQGDARRRRSDLRPGRLSVGFYPDYLF